MPCDCLSRHHRFRRIVKSPCVVISRHDIVGPVVTSTLPRQGWPGWQPFPGWSLAAAPLAGAPRAGHWRPPLAHVALQLAPLRESRCGRLLALRAGRSPPCPQAPPFQAAVPMGRVLAVGGWPCMGASRRLYIPVFQIRMEKMEVKRPPL
ncbi:hypothetical protein GW17_00029383 [Ensete ventricosum]|nr:hypothetical protein GW17_00029383 [Ensete ventricosum]